MKNNEEFEKYLNSGNIDFFKKYSFASNYLLLMKKAEDKNIDVQELRKGDQLFIGKNIKVDILWPESGHVKGEVSNNLSLVLKFEIKKGNDTLSILYTGDIDKRIEREIISDQGNNKLQIDILKIAHHGSKYSSDSEFLRKIKPKIAIISAGKNNLFNHPSKEVLRRLELNNVKYYITYEKGDIYLINGKFRFKK